MRPGAWRVVSFAAVAGLVSGAVVLVVYVQPSWAVRWVQGRSPEVLFQVPMDRRRVALTIDDGPSPGTPAILETLGRNRARATFFLIGERVAADPAMTARIAAAGHELANHHWRDQATVRLSDDERERGLLRTGAVIAAAAAAAEPGVAAAAASDDVPPPTPRWFRPGSGFYDADLLRLARDHGYRVALGSIYPFDPALPLPVLAARHILRAARPGAIIVLHDGPGRAGRTAETLRRVLPELTRRGYEVVTLSELARSAGETEIGGVR